MAAHDALDDALDKVRAESPIHGDGPCALCGRNPSAGYASAYDDHQPVWLCHDVVRRSCYVRWTVYGERPPSADAPGPWDVEPARPDHIDESVSPWFVQDLDRLSTKLAEATALAEERLAGLDRLRVECEAWQKASAGWQARCSELEGLLGEALAKNDG